MERRRFNNFEDRLAFIEFRQELLFDDDEVSRLLFEYQITENEYISLMDLMDECRRALENGARLLSVDYEQRVYEIVPSRKGDYHFCEYLAEAFFSQDRWKEVFLALYGNSPKYSFLRDRRYE